MMPTLLRVQFWIFRTWSWPLEVRIVSKPSPLVTIRSFNNQRFATCTAAADGFGWATAATRSRSDEPDEPSGCCSTLASVAAPIFKNGAISRIEQIVLAAACAISLCRLGSALSCVACPGICGASSMWVGPAGLLPSYAFVRLTAYTPQQIHFLIRCSSGRILLPT